MDKYSFKEYIQSPNIDVNKAIENKITHLDNQIDLFKDFLEKYPVNFDCVYQTAKYLYWLLAKYPDMKIDFFTFCEGFTDFDENNERYTKI